MSPEVMIAVKVTDKNMTDAMNADARSSLIEVESLAAIDKEMTILYVEIRDE